jgi:hypothetical protein
MLRLCAARSINFGRRNTCNSTKYSLPKRTVGSSSAIGRHVSLAQSIIFRSFATEKEERLPEEDDLDPEDEIPLLEYDETLFSTIEVTVKKRLEEKIAATYVSVRDAGSTLSFCYSIETVFSQSIFLSRFSGRLAVPV